MVNWINKILLINFGYVPMPDKPGHLKYDRGKYEKLLEESNKLGEFMREIIKSRESSI